MNTKKTKLEIIEETVQYYLNNKRSTSVNGCLYISKDGAKCAVGRCLKDELLENYRFKKSKCFNLNECSIDDLVIITRVNSINILLKEEYCGHDLEFWRELQIFHDKESNWVKNQTDENTNKLSLLGQSSLEALKKKYRDK